MQVAVSKLEAVQEIINEIVQIQADLCEKQKLNIAKQHEEVAKLANLHAREIESAILGIEQSHVILMKKATDQNIVSQSAYSTWLLAVFNFLNSQLTSLKRLDLKEYDALMELRQSGSEIFRKVHDLNKGIFVSGVTFAAVGNRLNDLMRKQREVVFVAQVSIDLTLNVEEPAPQKVIKPVAVVSTVAFPPQSSVEEGKSTVRAVVAPKPKTNITVVHGFKEAAHPIATVVPKSVTYDEVVASEMQKSSRPPRPNQVKKIVEVSISPAALSTLVQKSEPLNQHVPQNKQLVQQKVAKVESVTPAATQKQAVSQPKVQASHVVAPVEKNKAPMKPTSESAPKKRIVLTIGGKDVQL